MNTFRNNNLREPSFNVVCMNGSRFITFICSLSFFLAILGYPIAMALLSPWGVNADLASGENRLFTWTYRGFSILVSLLALAKVHSRPIPRIDWRMGLLAGFWLLYLIRAFWDLQVSPPSSPFAWNFGPGIGFQAWSYILLFTLLPMVVTLKSVDLIDFRRVQDWIFYFGGVGLVCALAANYATSSASWAIIEGRTNATAMLNTISYGHLGLTVAIVAVCRFLERKTLIRGVVCGVGFLIGLYAMLQAGSRGPLLALFVVVLIYAFSRSRYATIGMLGGGLVSFVIWLFMENLVEMIRGISPVMASRLEITLQEGNMSGRDELFSSVWQECLNNPITGFQLDFLGYSHNACLDGFMMFGLIFGWIVLMLVLLGYKAAYDVLKRGLPIMWLALIAAQYITAVQTSGMFGPNATIQCSLIALFVITSRKACCPSKNASALIKR